MLQYQFDNESNVLEKYDPKEKNRFYLYCLFIVSDKTYLDHDSLE